MSAKRLLYFHGFNSASRSNDKVLTISREYDVKPIGYDSFASYPRIFELLEEKVRREASKLEGGSLVLIGTSLGGYFANRLGRALGIPAVLINPAIRPSVSLQKAVGQRLENYVTGEVNEMAADIPSGYPDAHPDGPYLVLLDEGDEVFDAGHTASYFPAEKLALFEGGSHRFEHMGTAMPFVREFLGNIREENER